MMYGGAAKKKAAASIVAASSNILVEDLNSDDMNSVNEHLVSLAAAAASDPLLSIDPAIGLDHLSSKREPQSHHHQHQHSQQHPQHRQNHRDNPNNNSKHVPTIDELVEPPTPGTEFVDAGHNEQQYLDDKSDQGDQLDTNNKKKCHFCGKTFAHPGSLGRHLDLKRGSRLHPAELVDRIRGDVKRRGDAAEIKARRAKRAREYNSREDVKERAKTRRKLKEKSDRAMEIAKTKFISRIGKPTLLPHPSFANVVLHFLPPQNWPHDPPTKQTFDSLEKVVDELASSDANHSSFKTRLEVAFEQWSRMNMQTKKEVWARELRRAAEQALGHLSLYDLGSRDEWLRREQTRIAVELDDEDE